MDYEGKQFGNYRAARLLLEDGFTDIYKGEHVSLQTKAIIRIANTSYGVKYLIAGARILARFSHSNIMRLLDFGESNDTSFLVLEPVKETFLARYPQGSILTFTNVIPYIQQAASALYYAHIQGIINRNVKPYNMFFGAKDEIKLGDWDIAIDTRNPQNQDQVIVGTISYMAPEQIQGRAQAASDQYALAIVAYKWLCGSVPFRGSDEEVIDKHMHTSPSPLRSKVPSIPQAVEDVVLKALAKDPKDRFESVMAFAEALERASQPPKPKFHPNDLLRQQFGNYRLITLLGSGSVGDVYVAEHVTLGSKAAIKVLHQRMDAGQFRSAVRRLARLQHPNIIRVLDSGIQDGRAFLVLDYVAKGSLYQKHTQTGQSRLPLMMREMDLSSLFPWTKPSSNGYNKPTNRNKFF